MQLHHDIRGAWLAAADGMDAFMSAATRARLHAQADFARLLRGEPPMARINGPATPYRVVKDAPLARLLHYPAVGERRGAPLLIVASLINRYYVLDLLPEISVIDTLTRRGLDVWVLDWKAPGAAGPDLGFTDYVDGVIRWGAREAIAAMDARRVSVIGYCMGGTMAAMFAARYPELVQSLTLLGAPIDFHASGDLATWTAPGVFDADLLIDVTGNMPPALMQSGFKLTKPWDGLSKMVRLQQETDEFAVRHMVALESWLEDNIAFPGGVYREYIGRLYQDNAMIRGEMELAGDKIDLARINMPLLIVTATRDHICQPPASKALLPIASSTDKRVVEFDTGHIGMTASRRALQKLWPEIGSWISERGV